jgi:hypothetical protein
MTGLCEANVFFVIIHCKKGVSYFSVPSDILANGQENR